MLPSEIDIPENSESKTQAGPTPIHSALWEKPFLKWPNPALSSTIAWGQRAIERWNITQRTFHRNQTPLDAGSRIRLLPFGFVPRHAPAVY